MRTTASWPTTARPTVRRKRATLGPSCSRGSSSTERRKSMRGLVTPFAASVGLAAFAFVASAPLLATEATGADVIARYGLEEAATPVREHPGWRKPRRMIVGGSMAGALEEFRR